MKKHDYLQQKFKEAHDKRYAAVGAHAVGLEKWQELDEIYRQAEEILDLYSNGLQGKIVTSFKELDESKAEIVIPITIYNSDFEKSFDRDFDEDFIFRKTIDGDYINKDGDDLTRYFDYEPLDVIALTAPKIKKRPKSQDVLVILD